MYTVMGITGQVGGAAARTLLSAEKKVRAVVRDKAKAASWEDKSVELMVASGHDAAAMTEAFRGAEGVFVMMPPDFAPAAGYPEAREVAAALRQAIDESRPGKVVALSSVGAQRTKGLGLITQCHILEETLIPLPLPIAFIRAAWFMENSAWDVASARDLGEIAAFLAPRDRPFPMVGTGDIGELVAKTLQQDWTGQRFLELEGPVRYSQIDIEQTFSRLLNRVVKANLVPRGEWRALFEKQGTPVGRTAPRMEMLDGFNSGWIDFEGSARTEHINGRHTLEEVLHNLLRN